MKMLAEKPKRHAEMPMMYYTRQQRKKYLMCYCT